MRSSGKDRAAALLTVGAAVALLVATMSFAGAGRTRPCVGSCRHPTTTTSTTAPVTTTTMPATTTSTIPTTTTTTVPATTTTTTPPTAAPPMLVNWIGGAVLNYSDTQLAELAKLGVTGLAVGFGWLPDHGLGGSGADWTNIPDNFASRCHQAGITKLWGSFVPGNYNDPLTAFGNWFDDSEWTTRVVPSLSFVLTTMKAKGWNGIAFDDEMYPGLNNQRPTWDWNYTGNPGEAQVRAQARLRGQQLGGLIAQYFPGASLITYHDYFGDAQNYGYHSLLEHVVNGQPIDQYARDEVKVNFYDGLTGVPGLSALVIADASFYYGATQGGGMTMNDLQAMQFSAAGTKAYLQRTLTNRAVDVYPEPMILLGPSNGDGSGYSVQMAMTPDRALVVGQAARAASTGGYVVNYWPGDVSDPAQALNFTGDVVNGTPRLQNADLQPAYLAAAGR